MKTIWIGTIPGIFGYGISVAEETEEKCIKALQTAYTKCVEEGDQQFHASDNEYKNQFYEDGTEMTRFEKAFDYWGGSISEIELGKEYSDDFK